MKWTLRVTLTNGKVENWYEFDTFRQAEIEASGMRVGNRYVKDAVPIRLRLFSMREAGIADMKEEEMPF